MGVQPEGERKNDMGRLVFQGTDPIFHFPGSVFITEMLYKSHVGTAVLTYQNQVLHTNVYKGLRGVTSSSGHGAC